MAQTDYGSPASPFTGAQLNTRLGEWRDALHSLHKGPTRPPYATAGMLWLQEIASSEWRLWLFDGADDILLGTVNPTANTFLPAGLVGYALLAGATFTGAVAVPNASADTHALNRQTGDARYPRLDQANVFAAPQRVTGDLRVDRSDAGSEGGRLISRRASDNADGYFWQTFGTGSAPVFRLVRAFGTPAQILTIGDGGAVTLTGALTLPGAPTADLQAATKGYVDNAASDATRLLLVQDRKAANTSGGTSTSGAWRTRDLTHVAFNGIAGASLAGNQITLPTGTYNVTATAVADRPLFHRLRLQNITSGVQLALGLSHFDRIPYSDNGDVGVASLEDRFTLSGTAALELQHYVSQGRTTTGWGRPVNFDGQPEIYASLRILKVD
jgi:hypothetical protein